LAEDRPANSVTQHPKDAGTVSPSPGGEGRDEGERINLFIGQPPAAAVIMLEFPK
jgi:hypothetical protein